LLKANAFIIDLGGAYTIRAQGGIVKFMSKDFVFLNLKKDLIFNKIFVKQSFTIFFSEGV